jgi:hypothetical protein
MYIYMNIYICVYMYVYICAYMYVLRCDATTNTKKMSLKEYLQYAYSDKHDVYKVCETCTKFGIQLTGFEARG